MTGLIISSNHTIRTRSKLHSTDHCSLISSSGATKEARGNEIMVTNKIAPKAVYKSVSFVSVIELGNDRMVG